MKLLHLVVVASMASARVVPSPDTQLIENLTRDLRLDVTYADDTFLDYNEPSTASSAADPPTKFDKAVEIGRTLNNAMQSKDSVARWFFKDFSGFQETCQSPFDGDGKEELAKWGFNDGDELNKQVEKECDFDNYHKLKDAFDELGLDTRPSKDGGPNMCYKITHYDGPAIKRNEDGSLPNESKQFYEVCGKMYQATGATYEFAVNPNGMVALMNIMSMTYCAEKFTWYRKPKPDELPHIGTATDIAWAVWNRAGAADIKDIKYLIVTQVVNPGSRDIYIKALNSLDPPQSEWKLWPGQDFGIGTVGGQAILGSPVGRWAGYFILQHKEKLGGNRFIDKVKLWKPDGQSLPYLLFYVNPTPAASDSAVDPVPQELPPLDAVPIAMPKAQDMNSSRIVKRSTNGKHLVREHVMYSSS